ncbi:MAG: hypothetical protein FWE68_01470, partial [Defluviitaleaceae bacterium]|nr:hypothetical protein [Defluviitaleaceae bacterium]
MKVPDKHFILERTEKYLRDYIGKWRYMESVEIGGWQYAEYHADDAPLRLEDFSKIPESAFKPICFNGHWGGGDRTAWFKASLTVAPEFLTPGAKYCVKLIFGQQVDWPINVESLVYINGVGVQALDWCHLEAFIDDALLKDGKLEFAVKAWAQLG